MRSLSLVENEIEAHTIRYGAAIQRAAGNQGALGYNKKASSAFMTLDVALVQLLAQ